MRQLSRLAALTLTACTLALGGCVSDRMGDVGHKNIRPNASEYERNGNRINGVHSFGSPTYRTRFASDQANERNRWYGRHGLGNNIVGIHDNYRLEMNSRIAKQLAAMPEIDSAFVMLSDDNAYVGIKTNGKGGPHAQDSAGIARLKDKVADYVKGSAPRIDTVYVTSNPDFMARMQSYTDAAAKGHPVQGFLIEFNALVERIFPGGQDVSGTAGGKRSDLSSDTGMDTGTERGSALTGRYR